MDKIKMQVEKAITRNDAENSKIPLWELMGALEKQATDEIYAKAKEEGYMVALPDIFYDWRRRPEVLNHQYILRAWCLAVKKKAA